MALCIGSHKRAKLGSVTRTGSNYGSGLAGQCRYCGRGFNLLTKGYLIPKHVHNREIALAFYNDGEPLQTETLHA